MTTSEGTTGKTLPAETIPQSPFKTNGGLRAPWQRQDTLYAGVHGRKAAFATFNTIHKLNPSASKHAIRNSSNP